MSYIILWNAMDARTLYEAEHYETLPEAEDALRDFHERYPWNTYLLVEVKKTETGNGEDPPMFPKITFTAS